MKFLLARLARLRLRAVMLAHSLSNKVRATALSRVIRSRRFLMAAYMLVVIALAGAWWWDSPERFLGQRPPFTPPERTAPPVVTPPAVDPVTQPEAKAPVEEPPKEAKQKPPEQPAPAVAKPPPPAVPAIAAPATIETLHRPVAGEIAGKYGFRWSATHRDFRYHLGIGIAASPGSAVVAAYAGRIKSIETNNPEWGALVVVDHGGGWRTEYASITALTVRVGQTVTAGQKLGQLGPNPPARSADRPQLYFALFKGDESQDPAPKFR